MLQVQGLGGREGGVLAGMELGGRSEEEREEFLPTWDRGGREGGRSSGMGLGGGREEFRYGVRGREGGVLTDMGEGGYMHEFLQAGEEGIEGESQHLLQNTQDPPPPPRGTFFGSEGYIAASNHKHPSMGPMNVPCEVESI